MNIFELETAPQSFPEDYQQENGNYLNCCIECAKHFIGNKHRGICKLCEKERMTQSVMEHVRLSGEEQMREMR